MNNKLSKSFPSQRLLVAFYSQTDVNQNGTYCVAVVPDDDRPGQTKEIKYTGLTGAAFVDNYDYADKREVWCGYDKELDFKKSVTVFTPYKVWKPYKKQDFKK